MCQSRCDTRGIENSFLCLLFCRDFPGDPSCLSDLPLNSTALNVTALVASILNRPPMVDAAAVPDSSNPGQNLKPTCSSPSPTAEAKNGTAAPPPPVLGASFLQLGFNSFLGLPAHEQYGEHLRNPSELSL
jgi:hypothetical protein